MIVSRRRVLGGAAALVAGALVKVPARAAPSAVDFLVLGDWGRDGASHQRDVANAMGRWAQEVGSRFVVTVGDNFYDNGVRDERDPQWQSSFERIYTARSLQVPWYASLGNHDYRGEPDAQIGYARKSSRWRMPGRYYKVEGAAHGAPHLDLFILDTSPLVDKHRARTAGRLRDNAVRESGTAQLEWLDKALAASRAPWKLAAGHHPIFSGGYHGDTPEMIARVAPMLKRHGVRAYLAGHDHDLQFIERDGLSLIQSGGGSEVRPVKAVRGTEFHQSTSGFARIRSAAELLQLEFVDHSGRSLFKRKIPLAPELGRRAA